MHVWGCTVSPPCSPGTRSRSLLLSPHTQARHGSCVVLNRPDCLPATHSHSCGPPLHATPPAVSPPGLCTTVPSTPPSPPHPSPPRRPAVAFIASRSYPSGLNTCHGSHTQQAQLCALAATAATGELVQGKGQRQQGRVAGAAAPVGCCCCRPAPRSCSCTQVG